MSRPFIEYKSALNCQAKSGFVEFRKAMNSTTNFVTFNDALEKSATTADDWLLSIADRWQEAIAEAVQGALGWLQAQAAAVVAAMSQGPTASAQALPDLPQNDIAQALSEPFAEAGNQQTQKIKSTTDKVINFDFSLRNKNVSTFFESQTMSLIQQISDDQRQSIHNIISEGEKVGSSTEKMARQIRDQIGLTETQGKWVENYRDELINGDPGALDRELRDRRSDSKVQRNIDGKQLTTAEIDKLVAGYKSRMIAMRATAISRTESLRSAQYGAFASINAMLAEPSMAGMTVEKSWLATSDGKTREAHRECNGKKVIGLETPFSNGLIIPHDDDPNIPADEVINCRCTATFRIIADKNND